MERNVALTFIRERGPAWTQALPRDAHFEHENVGKVYEDSDIKGSAYIAMQLVKGESLACS